MKLIHVAVAVTLAVLAFTVLHYIGTDWLTFDTMLMMDGSFQ